MSTLKSLHFFFFFINLIHWNELLPRLIFLSWADDLKLFRIQLRSFSSISWCSQWFDLSNPWLISTAMMCYQILSLLTIRRIDVCSIRGGGKSRGYLSIVASAIVQCLTGGPVWKQSVALIRTDACWNNIGYVIWRCKPWHGGGGYLGKVTHCWRKVWHFCKYVTILLFRLINY